MINYSNQIIAIVNDYVLSIKYYKFSHICAKLYCNIIESIRLDKQLIEGRMINYIQNDQTKTLISSQLIPIIIQSTN